MSTRKTPRQRRLVKHLVAAGFGERIVAGALGCTRAELRRHFASEIAAAHAERRGELPGADASQIKSLDELLPSLASQPTNGNHDD